MFAEQEAALLRAAAAGPAEREALVGRRIAGAPLEHVLGWAEFAGSRIRVQPGVFVPRRRTVWLVELAERHLAGRPGRPVVVDLCCGSGAVGAALAGRRPVELYAVDLDPAAVRCARHNLPDPAWVYCGDLYRPLPVSLRGRVEVLLANAPYVPSAAIALMPAEAREHEPRLALDGGPDGLEVHRRVAAEAAGWLAPGGLLLIEVAPAQARAACTLLREAGLSPRVRADAGRDAVAVAAARA